jgi:hypothetical protein
LVSRDPCPNDTYSLCFDFGPRRRAVMSIVRYPEWHATLAQQHRGSLANGTAQGDGIRRAG